MFDWKPDTYGQGWHCKPARILNIDVSKSMERGGPWTVTFNGTTTLKKKFDTMIEAQAAAEHAAIKLAKQVKDWLDDDS